MIDFKYINIARKIDGDPHTAPKADDGIDFHPSFIKYLKLVYSPAEAEVIQHLHMPMEFRTPEQVADASGIDLGSVTKILDDAYKN